MCAFVAVVSTLVDGGFGCCILYRTVRCNADCTSVGTGCQLYVLCGVLDLCGVDMHLCVCCVRDVSGVLQCDLFHMCIFYQLWMMWSPDNMRLPIGGYPMFSPRTSCTLSPALMT